MAVIVERVESYKNVDTFIRKVFENLDFFESIGKRIGYTLRDFPEKVVIKPNFLKWTSLEKGCTTHPDVIKSIASLFKDMGKKVFIVEGGFTKDVAERYFREYNLKDYGKCINLNAEKFVSISVDGQRLRSVKVPEVAIKLIENAFFVSVPKLKVHHLTKVTIAIKNNMGFLKKPAINMHLNIDQKLIDLLTVFDPHLIIVDGVVGGENAEGNTKPVRHGIMIVADSAVEADAVGAYLMGFEPEEIGFLKIAKERGLGEIRLEKINIEGNLDGLRRKYSISGIRRFLGRLSI